MPYRVQRIEEFVKQVEAGDLKLRVRVLEVCKYIHIFLSIELGPIWINNLMMCLSYKFLCDSSTYNMYLNFLVWKSCSESNSTTNGYYVHSIRRNPSEYWCKFE